jgi:hypothetical protein
MTNQTNEGQSLEKLMADIEKFRQIALKSIDDTAEALIKLQNNLAAAAKKSKTGG